jgi:hypothetical protein
MAGSILRQQVRAARGRPWGKLRKHGLYGWDPSREWLKLPPREAVEAAREELALMAKNLMDASQFLPPSWDRGVARASGALLLMVSYLQELLEDDPAEVDIEEESLAS